MQINLDKIELNNRINALGLKSHYLRDHCEALYFDTELRMFVVVQKIEGNSRYTGKVLIPENNVCAAQVSPDSVPTYQPIGTGPERDTPSGTKRKHRTDDTAKSAIAEKIAARQAAKE